MKKLFLLIITFACMYGVVQAQPLTVINRTAGRIGVVVINKPFSRGDASRAALEWLVPNERVNFNAQGRLLGWHCPGFAAGYTVIDRHDNSIAFVEHANEIKSLHGTPRIIKLSNGKVEPLIFETKNPHYGEQACTDCAEDCYYERGNVARCPCLDWCWDHTRDMAWYLHPGDKVYVEVAAGTNIGVYEDADDGYVCQDGSCASIIRTTRYYY